MRRHSNRKARIDLSALEYAKRMYEALDTPVSLSCYLLLVNGEIDQLVRKDLNVYQYLTPDDFLLDFQAVKLMAKFPFKGRADSSREEAVKKFIWGENLCFETNERFRKRSDPCFTARVESVLFSTSRKISNILGDVPSLESLDFRFGPGATFGVRKETSVFNKIAADPECTHAFADKLAEFLAEFPTWFPPGIHEVKLVNGSQLTFVPKNAKTDRPICIEPTLNGLFQKGVGSYMRNRLRRWGVNLKDQGINQRLAQAAYEKDLCTVDFSSASDTIAYGLVYDLLPLDWAEFLDVGRCPSYLYDGRWRTFQKFSSMGNAYTFELETLIFFCIAKACCEYLGIEIEVGENLHVYGDDVIIPTAAYDLFQEVTGVCGFRINESKTFRNSPFYESCGKDYFMGTLVRPFQLDKELNKLLPAFYAGNIAKRFERRYKVTMAAPIPCRVRAAPGSRAIRSIFDWTVSCVPKHLRCFGPEGYGDNFFVADFDEVHPTRHRHYDGWVVQGYSERAIVTPLQEWPITYAVYHSGLSTPNGSIELLTRSLEGSRASEGYSVRGKTTLVKSSFFIFGFWPNVWDPSFDEIDGPSQD